MVEEFYQTHNPALLTRIVVDFENNEVKNIEVDFAYLPMWSNNEALPKVLTELIENICPIDEIDAVGIFFKGHNKQIIS